MTDDLHPYDGCERRFCDDDPAPAQRERGRRLVASLLRLPNAPTPGLRYSLSFYSGGDGVFDRLHVALACDADAAAAIAARAGFVAIEAAWEPEDRASLEWLVVDEDFPGRSFAGHAAAFVARERAAFQPAPGEAPRVWFTPGSDVNSWSLLYAVAGALAYIAQDHG